MRDDELPKHQLSVRDTSRDAVTPPQPTGISSLTQGNMMTPNPDKIINLILLIIGALLIGIGASSWTTGLGVFFAGIAFLPSRT
jgi:hypothetical protein